MDQQNPHIVPAAKPSRKGLWVGIGVVGALVMMIGLCIIGLVAVSGSDDNRADTPGKVSDVGVGSVGSAAKSSPTKNVIKTHPAGEIAEFKGADGLVGTMAISAGKMLNGKYGGKYLVATVDITVKEGQLEYNPYDYKLKSADGTQYNPGPFGGDGELHSGTLTAGRVVKGTLSFEVPDTALAGAEIEYAPGWGGTLAYWKVG